MCEVVVGVSHVDEALNETGTLYEAEEHLGANRNKIKSCSVGDTGGTSWRNTYLSQPGDVEAFPVLHRGLAGLARPRPFALAVGQAGPGEDVVVGQVQVRGVHRELADQLQQAGQAVEQPLQRKEFETVRLCLEQMEMIAESVPRRSGLPHHSPGLLVFGLQDARVEDLQEQLQTSR